MQTISNQNQIIKTNSHRLLKAVLLVAIALLVWKLPAFLSSKIPGKVLSTSAQDSPPVHIKISAIGVDAQVGKLGLNKDKTLAVPEKSEEVGWYIGSPTPGVVGPAIMVGHLDSTRGPAVFQNLKDLKAGDVISIDRADGSTVTFKVDSSQTFPQNNFPTDAVYGTLNYPGLRLITCTGTYSRLKGHYSDNLVVFASLVK